MDIEKMDTEEILTIAALTATGLAILFVVCKVIKNKRNGYSRVKMEDKKMESYSHC